MRQPSAFELSVVFPATNAEVFRDIALTHPPGSPLRLLAAKQRRLTEYPGTCPLHGETPFRVKHESCIACSQSARAFARARGYPQYRDTCLEHGEHSLFQTHNGACIACKTERAKAATPRAVARRNNEKTYLANCARHGPAAHSTAHGKCLGCFNAGGYARPKAPRGPTPRSEARKRGLATYSDQCDVHGPTAFSVRTGLCTSCFTEKGFRRVRT